jgi:pyrroloquinoline quinone (PQQ) biosynthesis protein C
MEYVSLEEHAEYLRRLVDALGLRNKILARSRAELQRKANTALQDWYSGDRWKSL